MFVLPGRNERIARALLVIETGERLAHATAVRQHELVSQAAMNPSVGAFLREQARQEAVHASYFGAGVKLFGGAVLPDAPAGALAEFRAHLEGDLERGDLLASLIGMQCVFEALGKSVLESFERSSSPKVRLFADFRRRIAREEASHHAFGARTIRAMTQAHPGEAVRAHAVASAYSQMGEAILRSSLPLFGDLGADCEACIERYATEIAVAIDPVRARCHG